MHDGTGSNYECEVMEVRMNQCGGSRGCLHMLLSGGKDDVRIFGVMLPDCKSNRSNADEMSIDLHD
jgi:hypothetical protein